MLSRIGEKGWRGIQAGGGGERGEKSERVWPDEKFIRSNYESISILKNLP